jgi:hypothetical protein
VGDGVGVGCCALDDRQLKQKAVMIPRITNHLKAKHTRTNEIEEHQLASPFLTLGVGLMITAADLIQSPSSLIIVFDYNFLVGATDVRHTLVCRDLKEEVYHRDERQTEVCRTSVSSKRQGDCFVRSALVPL